RAAKRTRRRTPVGGSDISTPGSFEALSIIVGASGPASSRRPQQDFRVRREQAKRRSGRGKFQPGRYRRTAVNTQPSGGAAGRRPKSRPTRALTAGTVA